MAAHVRQEDVSLKAYVRTNILNLAELLSTGGVVGTLGGACIGGLLKIVHVAAHSFLFYCSWGAIIVSVLAIGLCSYEVLTKDPKIPCKINNNTDFYKRVAISAALSCVCLALAFSVGGVALAIIGVTTLVTDECVRRRLLKSNNENIFLGEVVIGIAISILTNSIRAMFSPYLLIAGVVLNALSLQQVVHERNEYLKTLPKHPAI